MIDHISIGVKNLEVSTKFYNEILAILGYKQLLALEHKTWYFDGSKEGMKFGIISADVGDQNEDIGKARSFHIAFKAPSQESVNKWYEKALELGGTDNGKPGLRPHYHPNYYAAYIIDPSGWRIEVVCDS